MWLSSTGMIHYTAGAMIDGDGSGGNKENDPDFQPDTTYHLQGIALNSRTVPFIVLPPQVIKSVNPVVMGCECRLFNGVTQRSCVAIVGDIGPHSKLGELSIRAADLLGIPSNPRTGGESRHVIQYSVFPGEQATIDGITYPLQRA